LDALTGYVALKTIFSSPDLPTNFGKQCVFGEAWETFDNPEVLTKILENLEEPISILYPPTCVDTDEGVFGNELFMCSDYCTDANSDNSA